MTTDLRTWSQSDLEKLLTFTQDLSEQTEGEFVGFGEADDLVQAHEQALAYIKRRKNNTRLIDDAENKSIRKQVRSYLKRKRVIKD